MRAFVISREDRPGVGPAVAYHLDPPLEREDWFTGEQATCEFIVVSQSESEVLLAVQGCGETYAFPADEAGRVTDWGELAISRKGSGIHPDELMEMAGYEVVDTREGA